MSSAMHNFMEAYNAVHNSEAKEEFYSQRDPISEMNTGNLSDNDLREIAEEVCETLFDQGVTVKEAIAFIDEILAEGENVGRNKKVSRLYAAFAEAFDTITSKANQLEEFAKHRKSKKLQETWSARHNQEKRVQRHHSAIVAEDRAGVKAGLLKMVEGIRDMDPEKGTKERKARLEKKRGMKMDDHPQYKKEEVEVDEAMSSYDRNRKRAAQRAAERNAARAAGKTGVVPGVGYVSPRKERETYVDSAGTTRHKSGAKMEEVEQVDENRAAMGRINKEYHRKKEAEAMAARSKAPKDKKPAPKRLNDNPMYDAKSAGSSRVKGFKFTPTEEVENVEELYKGKHGQSDKEYADSRSQGGKMVSGDSKMSGAEYTHGRRVKAANPGMQSDVGGKTKPKSQGKMDKGTRADLTYRKANLKKSMKEAWADAYKAVYEVDEAAKPDYLDFDKDGNKKESMKKALKDKKKGNPKHGMKGHKCDDDCEHDENGNGGDMSEQFKFSEAELQRIQKIVDSW